MPNPLTALDVLFPEDYLTAHGATVCPRCGVRRIPRRIRQKDGTTLLRCGVCALVVEVLSVATQEGDAHA